MTIYNKVSWEQNAILIHTSVKLVTDLASLRSALGNDFNPHEREARDLRTTANRAPLDGILIHTSVKLVTGVPYQIVPFFFILIHTSVKLVTPPDTPSSLFVLRF